MYVIQTGGSQPAEPIPSPQSEKVKRNVFQAILCGVRGRCPACRKGRMFARYLKVADACPHCGEALHHHRADDAPPYFTIVIVGHIVVPLLLWLEIKVTPPVWVHMAIWLPLTVMLCLAILPVVKGAIVGLQWALYMHGFDPNAPREEDVSHEGH